MVDAHQGSSAGVTLGAGEVVRIGRGAGHDIVLHDPGVVNDHARVELDAAGEAVAIGVNGELWRDDEPVPAGEVVRLAGAGVWIGLSRVWAEPLEAGADVRRGEVIGAAVEGAAAERAAAEEAGAWGGGAAVAIGSRVPASASASAAGVVVGAGVGVGVGAATSTNERAGARVARRARLAATSRGGRWLSSAGALLALLLRGTMAAILVIAAVGSAAAALWPSEPWAEPPDSSTGAVAPAREPARPLSEPAQPSPERARSLSEPAHSLSEPAQPSAGPAQPTAGSSGP